MDLVVRDLIDEDLQHIHTLWHDPAVLKEQYALPSTWRADSPGFRAYLATKNRWPGHERRCSSILVDGVFAGCILVDVWTSPSGVVAASGWNLSASYWGRGIMPRALATVFDRVFEEAGPMSIVADCFSTNVRCQSVLAKLGFNREKLDWRARLDHFWRGGFRHKVWRHRLTAERWELQSAKFRNLPGTTDSAVSGSTKVGSRP